MRIKHINQDGMNMMLGRKLGEGMQRIVYECRLRDDLVVKVEKVDGPRSFANVHEDRFFAHYEFEPRVARWLAPTMMVSPDGYVMLQKKVQILKEDDRSKLPDMIPHFLTDVKLENFGWLDGRIVCCDYAFYHTNASTRLRKANWL